MRYLIFAFLLIGCKSTDKVCFVIDDFEIEAFALRCDSSFGSNCFLEPLTNETKGPVLLCLGLKKRFVPKRPYYGQLVPGTYGSLVKIKSISGIEGDLDDTNSCNMICGQIGDINGAYIISKTDSYYQPHVSCTELELYADSNGNWIKEKFNSVMLFDPENSKSVPGAGAPVLYYIFVIENYNLENEIVINFMTEDGDALNFSGKHEIGNLKKLTFDMDALW